MADFLSLWSENVFGLCGKQSRVRLVPPHACGDESLPPGGNLGHFADISTMVAHAFSPYRPSPRHKRRCPRDPPSPSSGGTPDHALLALSPAKQRVWQRARVGIDEIGVHPILRNFGFGNLLEKPGRFAAERVAASAGGEYVAAALVNTSTQCGRPKVRHFPYPCSQPRCWRPSESCPSVS